MTGHLTVQELEGFRNHTSAPQQLLRADRHLAGCPECQRRLRAAGSPALPGLAREGDGRLHATYDQICAYIDGAQAADEREWMGYHIQACAQCATEVNDLKQFDARMVAEKLAPSPVKKESSIRNWLAAFFAAPQRPSFVTAALSLLVIGVVAMTRVHVDYPADVQTRTVLHDLTHFAPGDAKYFYGGLVLAALGVAGVWYRFRK